MNLNPGNDARMQILEMIANRQISAKEGVRLLEALNRDGEGEDLDETLAWEIDPVVLGQDQPAVSQHLQVETEGTKPVIENEDPFPSQGDAVLVPVEIVESAESWQKVAGDPAQAPEVDYMHKQVPDHSIEKWKRWWMLPLWIGVGVTISGGLLMFWAFQATRFSFWFACAWFPFLIGIGLTAIAWALRKARWLHVRITQKQGEWPRRISISLPLPLNLAGWFLKTFQSRIPGLPFENMDEMLEGLRSTTSDEPFFLEVDEGEDGERVEVYIG
jgi:hypothetical protein